MTLASIKRAGAPPRYATPRTPSRPTLGGRVAQVAEQLGRPFMPWQRQLMDVALELDENTGLLAYSEVDLIVMRQNGKAIDSNESILTPSGWRRMGDLGVGDQVFHPDGHAVTVTHAFDELVGRDCYRVTTVDGRSIVADADHLWRVRDTGIQPKSPWRTLTTSELLVAGLRRTRGFRFQLPVQRAIKTPNVSLPLDPYLLGAWLGDGTAARGEMTSADPEILEAFETAGFVLSYSYPRGRATTRGIPALGGVLRELGVLNAKHVPDVYLAAGHDQRLALLQGLMDTDGSISDHSDTSNRVEFCSTSYRLADAVLYLARSLGWRATCRQAVALLNGRDCGPKWRVCFTPTTDDPRPFRLARKARRVQQPRARGGELAAVSIRSIEPVASRPVRCIKVDSPDGLFLVGRDLIATHNSEATLPLMTHRCMGFNMLLVDWVRKEYGLDVPRPGPQRVLYLAQTADEARKKWRQVHMARLQANKYTENAFTPTLTQNKEAFTFWNGSIWSPGSTTAKTGGTGESLDLGVIDEAWSHKTSRVETGLRPTMLTRPWSQLWVVSMVPGLSRALPSEWGYLRAKMVAGRARVDAGMRSGVCYVEYGAEEGLDPGDPATWWSAMPALGHTITEARIREDFDSWRDAGRLVDFCAEYLSIAPTVNTARWQVIDEPVWNNRIDQVSRPLDPIAIGVASTTERSKTSIGLAALRDDGNVHLELLDRIGGVDGAVDVIMELLEDHDICSITIDPAGPEASILDNLRARMAREGHTVPVYTPSLREMCAASARVYDATGQVDPNSEGTDREPTEWVCHLGQAELNRGVATATKYLVGDVWRWDFSGSVDPLRAVTAAWWGGIRSEWAGGGYDISTSLG